MSEITVTIDGKELAGREGQTILELALENGIEIPNLCYDPRLRPSGSCRLCLVEVEGQTDPVASCTFAIASGMQVRTETQQLRELRKTILELLFYEHRGACTTCNEMQRKRLLHAPALCL
jgi:NADH dehydrogenase/NADH:ubiquinone oxidoreductase subunit G